MRRLFLLSLAVASLSVSAQTAGEAPCLAPDELRLGPLAVGAPVALVAALGSPDDSDAGLEEDDGGWTTVSTLWFGELWVDLVRDRVDAVGTEFDSVVGPRGVHVGMTRDEAERRLGGHFGEGETDDEGWVPSCLVGAGLVATYTEDGRLGELQLVMLRP